MFPGQTDTRLEIRIAEDFDHPGVSREAWERLLTSGPSNVVSLTFDWQREWWDAFGGDRLLIVLAERSGELQAIAPLFAIEGTLCLVGSAGADRLDFIGRPDEAALAQMLAAAISQVPDCAGLNLFHIPAGSPTEAMLPGVASRLGLELLEGGRALAPYIDLTDAERVRQLVGRRRIRQEWERMRRVAPLEIRLAGEDDVDPWLEVFFAQHAARWSPHGEPGLEGPEDRRFFRAILHSAERQGWLRFAMLAWDGRPAAFEIGLTYAGRYLDYMVARDVAITNYSPGKLLEAHSIAAALESGARRFDFGLGEEPYKLRYATGVAEVIDWGLWAE